MIRSIKNAITHNAYTVMESQSVFNGQLRLARLGARSMCHESRSACKFYFVRETFALEILLYPVTSNTMFLNGLVVCMCI